MTLPEAPSPASEVTPDPSPASSTQTLENLTPPPPASSSDEAAPSETDALLAAASEETPMITVNEKQDYRLDFTEVEGTLEEIPEEATATLAGTTNTTTTTQAPLPQGEDLIMASAVQVQTKIKRVA